LRQIRLAFLPKILISRRFSLSSGCGSIQKKRSALSVVFGVAYDYDRVYNSLAENNIYLVHTPEQHWRAGNLDGWYPFVEELTARSLWFDTPPSVEEGEREFSYPVFIRGTFQTNRHKASFSVVRSREDYQRVVSEYCSHPRLNKQKFVVREFLPLRPVERKVNTDRVVPSFEFRSFWWKGDLVGFGPYWNTVADYAITRSEELSAISLSKQVAHRVNVPFLVVDVAQLTDGQWVLIECNDGQESGYAGISPLSMWQGLLKSSEATNSFLIGLSFLLRQTSSAIQIIYSAPR
jgi:hypothetical protein